MSAVPKYVRARAYRSMLVSLTRAPLGPAGPLGPPPALGGAGLYLPAWSSDSTANLPPAPIHVSGGRSAGELVKLMFPQGNGGMTRTREYPLASPALAKTPPPSSTFASFGELNVPSGIT